MNYNYHTHTYRCNHASMCKDLEYVENARKVGIKNLGFSCHIPNPLLEYHKKIERMSLKTSKEYIRSINKLKKKYKDMNILCGFEAEYNPLHIEYLCSMKDKVDYMILGEHYIPNSYKLEKIDPYYPIKYADMVCNALETGIFDILAHPDIFMKYRDKFKGDDYNLFISNSSYAIEKICKTASELDIPLEINLTSIRKNKKMKDFDYSYPTKLFFDTIIKYNNRVLFGVDAHNPEDFNYIEDNLKTLNNYINLEDLFYIEEGYNPVNRSNILNNLYNNTLNNKDSYINNILKYINESNYIEYLNNMEDYYINEYINLNKEDYYNIEDTYKKKIKLVKKLYKIVGNKYE